MKVAGIAVYLIAACFSFSLQAQQVGSIEDSIPVIQADSVVVREGLSTESQRGGIITLSSDAFFAPSYMFKPSPKKAVIYSAMFPGLGQIYNRNYWKLPILYGGFVAFTYFITWNNGYYRTYFEAYKEIIDGNPETIRWHNLLPYGMDPDTVDDEWFADVLQQRKDYYRYYRDLSIIGTVALYLLAIVDAYVDAQLFDFDMSPDLSMRLEPTILKEDRPNYIGNSYGLQWSFSF